MRWLPFRRTSRSAAIDAAAEAEALDRLLAQYVVEVPDATVEEICRNLAALPSNRSAAAAWTQRARPVPLFWPGLGLAFGMLLLGIVIGTPGLPIPLSATDQQAEFSDLLMPRGA